MPWTFNPFSGTFDQKGSGGGGSVLEGEVATFADLPQTTGTPPVGSSYLVRESTGVWLVNRRQAGIYIRTNNTGVRADDWSYGGDFPVQSVNGETGAVSLSAADLDAAEANHVHQPADIYSDAVYVSSTTLSGGEPNGVYFRNGSDNGKAIYKSAAGYALFWSDENKWTIGNNAQSAAYFVSSTDSIYPWQATGWIVGPNGSGTVPTVAQATLSQVQFEQAKESVSTRTPKSGNASATEVVLGSDTRLTNSRTPTSHTHGNITNSGAVGTTANLPLKTGTNGVIEVGAFGTAAGSFCEGNDARLSDDRDPNLHAASHAAAGSDPVTLGPSQIVSVSGFGNVWGGNESLADIFSNVGNIIVKDQSDYAASGSITASGLTQATARILGRTTASTGAVEEIQIGTGLSLSAGELSATASGGSKTYAVFTAEHNQPPASAYATLDTRNSVAVLDFDAATDENAVFVGIMPEAASLGSGLIVRLHWMATTATSGNVRWGVQFERSNTDLDSDSFAAAVEANGAANGTSGILTTTAITVTDFDGITAGDVFRLKVFRNADDATNDTMTGDAELVAVEVRSAA